MQKDIPGRDPVHHDPFGEVHGVGDGQDDQFGGGAGWPFEQVVQHGLLSVPEHVQLVHKENGCLARTSLGREEIVQEVGGVVSSHLLLVAFQLLPDLDVGLGGRE